jgi:methyl-accepting chemotaxis protein
MRLGAISLKHRMLIGLGTFSMAIFVTFLLINLRFTRQALMEVSFETALSRVQSSALGIDGFFREKTKTAWTIAQDPSFRRWLAGNTERRIDHADDPGYQSFIRQFKSIVKNDPEIKSVFVACEASQEYFDEAERDPGEDYYVGKRPWYQEATQGRKPRFDVAVDLLDQQVYVSYNLPIYDEQGKLLGVSGVDIRPATLQQQLEELKMFDSCIPMLLDTDGQFVIHPAKELVLQKTLADLEDGERFRDLRAAMEPMLQGRTGIADVVYDGREQFLVYTPIETLESILVLAVPKSELLAQYDHLERISIWLLAVAVAVYMGLLLVFTRLTTRPVEMLASLCSSFVRDDGDRRRRSENEIGLFRRTFRVMSEYIGEVAEASTGIVASSRRIASGTQQQEKMAGKASAVLQEMTARVDSSAHHASRAGEITRLARETTQESVARMGEMAKAMATLQESSRETLSFIATIEEIALQTNMLALNAAVEASHAGDSGRGFAVVAEEIRQLAHRSSEASSRISDVLRRTEADVRRGSSLSAEVLAQFEKFHEQVGAVEGAMAHIAEMTNQHTETIRTVNTMFNAVCEIAQANAESSEASSGGAGVLAERTLSIKSRLPEFEVV